jgi:hypothetical protein
LTIGIAIKDTFPLKMDFIRKPEVLATANAIGTASIYFILSKRLNSLTEEMDEIDNHLTSSIKKISENARTIQGMTETFKEVLTRFEEHRKAIANFAKIWKKLEDDFEDMNDRYDMLFTAVKELGGNVDVRKLKKKKKKSKSYDDRREDRRAEERRDERREERRRKSESSSSESSDSEGDRERNKKKPQKKEQKQEYNSDEDFVKKAQEAKKNSS